MDLLQRLKQWRVTESETEEGSSVGAAEEDPFAYLRERRQQQEAAASGQKSLQERLEERFVTRSNAAFEVLEFVAEVLEQLRTAAYPEDEVWDFVHWLNADDRCPWQLFPDTNEYGLRLDEFRLQHFDWNHYELPEIRWLIGRYPSGQYGHLAWWAFKRKIEVRLQFGDEDEPLQFVCVREGAERPLTARLDLEDLSRALIQLHP